MTGPLLASHEIAGHLPIRMATPKGYACLRRREARGGFVSAACDTEPGSASLAVTWIVEFAQGRDREGR